MDARGHKKPPNKTLEENLPFIRSHIESHYSRSDNHDIKYLSPDLSVSKMHYLYKEKCDKEKQRAVSDWVYQNILNEEYNLLFGRCISIHHTLSPHPFLPHTPHTHPTNPSPHTPSSHQPLTPHTFIPPTPQSTHMLTKSISSCEHTPSLYMQHIHSFITHPILVLFTPAFSFTKPKSDTCKTWDSNRS